MNEGQLYNVNQLAQYLNCHPRTIRRRVKDNTIPHFLLWGTPRFDKEQISRWLEKKKRGPKDL